MAATAGVQAYEASQKLRTGTRKPATTDEPGTMVPRGKVRANFKIGNVPSPQVPRYGAV
jgi:hypothetical protein